MKRSVAIEEVVEQYTQKLIRLGVSGGHCQVVIDESSHLKRGGVFQVSVRLTVPGEKLYVAASEERNSSIEFVHAAIHRAYDKLERQILKHHKKCGRQLSEEMAA